MHISGFGSINISRDDPEAIKKVAKEMESMFIYELLKEMRKSLKNDFSSGVYMSMFDMELSRAMSERGLGLDKIIERQLSRPSEEPSEEPSDDKYINSELKYSVGPSDKRIEDSLGGGEK